MTLEIVTIANHVLQKPAGSESILHVRDPQGATFGQYAYNIETDGLIVRLVIGEVLLGKRAYGGLLARCYGFERVSERS